MNNPVQSNIDLLMNQSNKNLFLTTPNGSSVGRVPHGKSGVYNINADQSVSLQEQPVTYSLSPFSTVPSAAFQGGGNSTVDFVLPAGCGVLRNVFAMMTMLNSHASAAHVFEAPVMPFSFRRIQVLQNNAQVGLDILPDVIWKYIGYTSTLNELTVLQTRTTIDKATFALASSQNLASGASRIFALDLAPFLHFVQAKMSVKHCDPITLRFYIEDMSVIAPTNTNSTNASIQLTNFTLMLTEIGLSKADNDRIDREYQKPVSGRCIEAKQETATISAVSGSNVQYNTNGFNNLQVVMADVGLRSTTVSGSAITSYTQVNSIYMTSQDGVNLHGGLQPTDSDWRNVIALQNLPNTIFLQASNIYLYPVFIGSTNVLESLKKAKQLGYTVIPNRCVVNVNSTATGSRQLQMTAFCLKECRFEKGKLTVW
jgi:hypothetical protein